ncbi:hypothetical protein SC1083_0773 [Aggregatibacter actinomycetemcomitans serotype e str. SC1083]|uniref:Uncharacterized protein n=1 Tax=Aggregatibacter actinomycetemcomitans serotype e str. SC1083 TaxID=907488 RepID=G4A7H7_AGGAC|nr:hypothetical protein SC1083_0773 [Aggregatibacter actinomycetemcomitans serotype e str. SC1083]
MCNKIKFDLSHQKQLIYRAQHHYTLSQYEKHLLHYIHYSRGLLWIFENPG